MMYEKSAPPIQCLACMFIGMICKSCSVGALYFD